MSMDAILRRLSQDIPMAGCLFGGAILDRILGANGRPKDVDVAFEGDEGVLTRLLDLLRARGYVVRAGNRRFRMNHDRTCLVQEVERDDWVIDLAIVRSLDEIGQFSIDSIRVTLPRLTLVDRFDGRRAFLARRLEFVRPLHRENPYLLLNRMLVLAAKYRVRFTAPAENADLTARLAVRFREFGRAESDLYAGEDRAGFLSTLMRSLLRAPERSRVLDELLECGLLHAAHSELAGWLDRCRRAAGPELDRIRAYDQMADWLRADGGDHAARLFAPLRLRWWSATDRQFLQNLGQARLPAMPPLVRGA